MTKTSSRTGWVARRTMVGTAVIASAALVLTGCGTTSENSGQGGGSDNPEQQLANCKGPEGKYKIGVSQANKAEPYRERMDSEIQKFADRIPQFEVEFADAAKDNTKQKEQVENFITQKVDLLMISPNESTPLTQVVKKAYDAKIPVVVLDRKVDGEAYTTWIGADNVDIGKQAGEYISKNLLPNGGNLIEIKGLSGSTPAKERHDGFMSAIEGKNVNVVGDGDGGWERDGGQQQADQLLKSHPDVNVIYSQNDPMGEAAKIAADNAGRPDVQVTGIDGLPIESGGIKAVESGRLAATFVYPTGSKQAVESAKSLLIDCKNVEKKQTLPTELVTKDNAEEVYTRLNAE